MNFQIKDPKVTILLGTYNGEKYLKMQLNSIINQKYSNICIFARDDGSSDSTIDILEEYSRKCDLKYVQGKNVGAFANFFTLIHMAPESPFYAYCDQDDIWGHDKIRKAVHDMEKEPATKPMIYIHATKYINNNFQIIGKSNIESPETAQNLKYAIIRNICQGSACVFNAPLMHQIKKLSIPSDFEHDWWTYLVCLVINGEVLIDKEPLILYRQHGDNVVGAKSGIVKRFRRRLGTVFHKDHKRQRLCHSLLDLYENDLDDKNLKTLKEVSEYRDNIYNWFTLLFDYKFYRGINFEYGLSFWIAVLTKTV